MDDGEEAGAGAPNVKFAQRKDAIFLTVELPDVTNETIEVRAESLCVKGTSGGRKYAMDVKLFKAVNPKESNFKVYPLGIQIFLTKAVVEDLFWQRGTDGKGGECVIENKPFEKKHFAPGGWASEEEWRAEGGTEEEQRAWAERAAGERKKKEQMERDAETQLEAARQEVHREAARAQKEKERLEKQKVRSWEPPTTVD
jgi:hypothetical protein